MIRWTIETRKLSDLKPYEKNPRRITEKGLNDLVKSLELFGLAEPVVINRDDTIIGGHARWTGLKRIKGKAAKVDVYVPDRLLDEAEVRELLVRLNKNIAGGWDFEMLGNEYDPRDLVAWGFTEDELGLGDPESEDQGATDGEDAGEADDDRIIKCPKCKHEFSVLEKKKKKK